MSSLKSLPRTRLAWVVLAAIAAAVINANPIPFIEGTEISFGMAIALLVVFLLGQWWGLVAAIPAALLTISNWGEPYSCSILLLEVALLSTLCGSRLAKPMLTRGYALIADFIYWLCIGCPLYYLSYRYMLGLDAKDALAVSEKALLDGTLNILIAYAAYTIIILIKNRRSPEKATISIQAISLTSTWGLIVSCTLLNTIHNYDIFADILATRLSNGFNKQGEYALALLEPNAEKTQQSLVFIDLKSFNKAFKWAPNDTEPVTSNPEFFDTIKNTYINATSQTTVSRKLAKYLSSPNKVSLYMPSKQDEKLLLRRFHNGVWIVDFYFNNKQVLTLAREAKEEFQELLTFFLNALETLIFSLVIGIAISLVAARLITREFERVQNRQAISEDSKGQTSSSIQRMLKLSPISEVHQLATEVNRRNLLLQESKRRIEELNRIAQQQLSTAGEIQQCFLGSKVKSQEGLDISLFMRPAYDAGGDWYDAFEIQGKTYLVVADVCDKGVGAALFMSVFRSLIRYAAQSVATETLATTGHADEDLSAIISTVNNYMSTEHGDTSMFATVFLACIHNQTHKLRYVLAGHEKPILLDSKGNIYEFQVSGPAVGLFPDAPYKTTTINFEENSLLLAYSDGVLDARNSENQSFGKDNLIDFVRTIKYAASNTSAETITQELVKMLDAHIGSSEQFDDITIATVLL